MNPLDLAAWCAALFLAANLFPHTVALRLTLLVLGLAFAALALARAKRPLDIRVLPPLLVPILLWAAWAAVSIKWSVEPERSMKEYKNEVAYVFLGYWLCWIAAQAPGARRAFGLALVPGATASCLIGLYVYAVPAASPWIERFANGPGDQSSALLTLMPLVLLAIWLTRKERTSRALWALPLLMLAAAYATLNRTVWLGFAAEIVVLAALLLPRTEFARLRASHRGRAVGGIAAIALAGGLALAMVHVQEDRVALAPGAAVAKDPRFAIWTEALDSIRQQPVTGLGFGRGIDRRSLTEELGNPQYWHAHNLLLETAVETGLPGATLLLILICGLAYRGWRQARGADLAAAFTGAALIAVVAGMFLRNMTDTLLVRQNALLFWGVAALLLGLGAAQGRRA
ncbi:MAG TPA: O-antigen ligase family protein [Burkholderiales bacterium]|nr:O-antigen ligase family protein [Burkholderiales bacterium]